METDKKITAKELQDPDVVFLNMLRGTIAKPSMRQISHIYQEAFVEEIKLLISRGEAVMDIPEDKIDDILRRAAYGGVSSLLLDVQRDCIREKKRADRLQSKLDKLESDKGST